MTADVYLVYLATVAIFFATPPGTSQILIISNALRHGARRSLWTGAGDLSANALQILAAGLGLGVLIAVSSEALSVIKWLGVAYLVWFGIRTFRTPVPDLRTGAVQTASRRGLYLQGFVTSAANPEAVFFFAALFPQFLDPAAPLAPQLLILGVTYLIVDGVILALMAAGAARLLVPLRHRAVALNRIAGTLMIGAAVLLGLKDPNVR